LAIYVIFSYLFVSSYRKGYKSVETELADDRMVREHALYSILRDFKLQDARRQSKTFASRRIGKQPPGKKARRTKLPSKTPKASQMRKEPNVHQEPYQESS
jgi:hypothetical protein